MGLVTWTAVFTLESLQDTSQEAAASLNGLIGADLQKNAKPILNAAGWNFGDAWPESHGWHSGATVDDEGKTIVATFVTSPELDEAEPDGRARSVLGARHIHFHDIADDLEDPRVPYEIANHPLSPG